MPDPQDLEIIYIGDPMCSWCWGFAPVLDEKRTNYDELASFRIIVGGLRPGPSAGLMDEKLKRVIREHWQHVQEATGQPFNHQFFEREGFLYDTEPAAKAVVAVRHLAPEQEFSFFKTLQRGFYAENIDITREENYVPMLWEHGIAEELFMKTFTSETTQTATYQDVASSQQFGIRGFPSVVLRKHDQYALLTAGYQPYEYLESHISEYFNGSS